MKQLALPRRIVVTILCLLSDNLIAVNTHICQVGREKNQHNEWKWVLPYPDPCKCTNIIMGGMNTWTPIQACVPVYVDSPLLSDDIIAIREHYGLTCNTGTTPTCASGTDSSAGTATTKTIKENHAIGSFDISFSSQGEASGTYETKPETSGHALTTASGSAAAESSTNSASSKPSETIEAASTEAWNSDHASTTSSGSTAAENSTNSATSVPSETSDAASTKASTLALKSTAAESSTSFTSSIPHDSSVAASSEAGTSLKIATSSGTPNSRSTSPKVCEEYLGMESGDIPDSNIAASYSYNDRLPETGRLNAGTFWGCKLLTQCTSEATTWIQADIGYQTTVSGVITQGDGPGTDTGYWVTELKVSTFKMTTDDQPVFVTDGNGNVKVFQANTDRDSIVTSTFPNPVYARIVRITCVSTDSTSETGNNLQMRFEILGCKQAIH